MYGTHIQDMGDEYVRLSQKAMEGLSIVRVPGRFWIEHFPLLQYVPSWFPGATARRIGDLYRPVVSATRNELYEKIEQEVVSTC